jgi:ribosomal protein L12E/L44/L45/RPP1/RPP2
LNTGPGSNVPYDAWDDGEALTPADLARLDADLDPADFDEPEAFDTYSSPPDGEDAWLADLATPVLNALPDPDRRRVRREPWPAGFTHRAGGSGAGFAAGGLLDQMEPGPELAAFADDAWQRGLSALTDGELCGLICAQRRLASRASAGELAAIAELDVRRAGPGGRPGEHVQDELAALQTLTGRSAADSLAHARAMRQVPGVAGALATGRIDLPKAEVFADETCCLDEIPRAAICAAVLPRAAEMTTGELRKALRSEIAAYDPQAQIRRRKKAEKQARVEAWTEPAGTSALAGRDLPPAGVITADKWIDAQAKRLKAAGVAGTMDQLRASVFLAVLSGRPIDSLFPPSADSVFAASPGTSACKAPTAGAAGGSGRGGGSAPATGSFPGLSGSVHLIMPASAWLGLSDMPGEAAGLGAHDADTCRDLAATLAARRDSRWCLTLTDRRGRAVAHGCARAGPGPPGSGDRTAWLKGIKICTLEHGSCTHQRESVGYRPPASLRHLIKIRDRECGFRGCRRPAYRCDDDHTLAYHKGGKTGECNLYPMCRAHHRAKQAAGWRLEQPEPGVLIWTLPSGRKVTVSAEPYPRG